MDDEEIAREVIAPFLSEFPEQLLKLENALSTGDYSKVRELAHRMKEAVSNLSSPRLKQLLQGMEEQALSPVKTELQPLLLRIQQEQKALKELLL